MFSSKVTAALVALPFLAHATLAQTCDRSYVVQAGDICDGISAAHNVSTYQLATVNADAINSDCSNLVPGQTLCLGWGGSDCTNTYVVQLGDDCDSVASTYSLNTTMLFENNPQIDAACDNLYVGEVLCVASGVEVPTAGGVPSSGASSLVPSTTPVLPTASVLSSTASIISTPIVTLSQPVGTFTYSPTVTLSEPVTTSSTAPSASATGDDSGDDDGGDGDDDLPWCDEL